MWPWRIQYHDIANNHSTLGYLSRLRDQSSWKRGAIVKPHSLRWPSVAQARLTLFRLPWSARFSHQRGNILEDQKPGSTKRINIPCIVVFFPSHLILLRVFYYARLGIVSYVGSIQMGIVSRLVLVWWVPDEPHVRSELARSRSFEALLV